MSNTSQSDATHLTAFDRFLQVAADKPFEQKLLLVFAQKERREAGPDLSADALATLDFAINPIMYTDKLLREVVDFKSLLADSLANGSPWDLLIVAALDAAKFSPAVIQQRLEMMVKLIQQGESERFLIFNAMGDMATLSKADDQPDMAVQ